MTTNGRVQGVRGELLALVSHLPRCEHPRCDRGGKRRPIATFTTGREYLCGFCAGRRSTVRVQELPYRRVLRWMLHALAAGQVVQGGTQTLTIVGPDGSLGDVTDVLDEHDTDTTGRTAR